MKIAAMALLAAFSLQAGQQTIVAYVANDVNLPAPDLSLAEARAAKVLSLAGVEIKWKRGEVTFEARPIQPAVQIHIIPNLPANQDPTALAVALPYEGVHLTIFYQRLLETMPDQPQLLLAYVLVHEITHLLQGFSHHSQTGVMKANWDRNDSCLMQRNRFFLSPQDVELIRLGLGQRQTRLLVAASSLSEAPSR